MRYPPAHKDRVRERIVRAASRRFRDAGGGGAAIAELMSDLKLTHGGFYRHFRGKEQLFVEAFKAAAAETRGRLRAAAAQAPAGRKLEAMINAYLSAGHCADPGRGCPIAALAGEISRHPKPARAALDRALHETAAELAPFLPGDRPAAREQSAVVLLSGMAGTLMLARACASAPRRQDMLRRARRFYLQLARHGA